MITLSKLKAISPIDGRYFDKVSFLSHYFSESAFMKYRLQIEVEYFIYLIENLPEYEYVDIPKDKLRDIYKTFNEGNALSIKVIEAGINHDVKAIEYYLKDKLKELGLSEYSELIHFGLTSQDINNTAIPIMIQDWMEEFYLPKITRLIDVILKLSKIWDNIPMLAHTHGQAASPTKLGKEFMVYVQRLNIQVETLRNIPFTGKFGGAVGNFNAHRVAYPNFDWQRFADTFLEERLGLYRQKYTTQIEHYDLMCSMFDNIKRINTILIDMCRDIWQYISMDYFKLQSNNNDVGSSTMPHKVNPIDFENAEGNLGMANAILSHFSEKLPISRLQRDLTDSTVLRNIGVPMGHTHVAIESLLYGIMLIEPNKDKMNSDLENNWMVVTEGIQTILRREKYEKPYEKLKEFSRGKLITKDLISDFIDSLEIKEEVKQELKNINPQNYTGIY
jgi:adenylosuccinate lyase